MGLVVKPRASHQTNGSLSQILGCQSCDGNSSMPAAEHVHTAPYQALFNDSEMCLAMQKLQNLLVTLPVMCMHAKRC